MVGGARVIVVLPAYNAEKTLEVTLSEVPPGVVDEFLLVDDASNDGTVAEARRVGVPYIVHPRIANRALTLIENLFLGVKLSEYHTGYRAFSRRVLDTLPLLKASDDFVFDNQMLAQCVAFGFNISKISCPTKYFPEASSINFSRSVVYGLAVLATAMRFRLHRLGLRNDSLFEAHARRLEVNVRREPAPPVAQQSVL